MVIPLFNTLKLYFSFKFSPFRFKHVKTLQNHFSSKSRRLNPEKLCRAIFNLPVPFFDAHCPEFPLQSATLSSAKPFSKNWRLSTSATSSTEFRWFSRYFYSKLPSEISKFLSISNNYQSYCKKVSIFQGKLCQNFPGIPNFPFSQFFPYLGPFFYWNRF